MLNIGEASSRLRWGEYDEVINLLAAVNERHPGGPLAPEAIYWRGIAAYLNSHDNDAMYAISQYQPWPELSDQSGIRQYRQTPDVH